MFKVKFKPQYDDTACNEMYYRWSIDRELEVPLTIDINHPTFGKICLSSSTTRPRVVVETGKVKFMDIARNQDLEMTAGKYVKRILCNEDGSDLAPTTVQEMAEKIKHMTDRYELKWAETRSEIRDVYLNGPSSCMSGRCVMREVQSYDEDGGRFTYTNAHPAEVYATPDIRIAYLIDKVKDNKIVARTVTSTKKKTFTDVYGLYSVMKKQLDDAGYKLISGYRPLSNHRILRLPCADGEDNYLMPYIDGHSGVSSCEDDEYFVIDGGGYHHYNCETTLGCTNDDEYMFTCESCHDTCHEDYMRTVNDGNLVICESCYQDFASCDSCGIEVHCDEIISTRNGWGDNYCEDCYRENHEDCHSCGDEIHINDATWAVDGYAYCDDCYVCNFSECEECGGENHIDDMRGCVENIDGHETNMCNDCYRETQAEIKRRECPVYVARMNWCDAQKRLRYATADQQTHDRYYGDIINGRMETTNTRERINEIFCSSLDRYMDALKSEVIAFREWEKVAAEHDALSPESVAQLEALAT